MSYDNRILHSCTFSIEFIKLVVKKMIIAKYDGIIFNKIRPKCCFALAINGFLSFMYHQFLYNDYSDCRSRGCECDPGPVPYFNGD